MSATPAPRWPEPWARIEAAVTARATSLASRLHGPRHWRAVARVSMALAQRTPAADFPLVVLFGLFHDSQRWHDGHDPEHGPRAAALVRALASENTLDLSPGRLDRLCLACAEHADGLTSDDPTIGACWDADRLNLWRCGITPVHRLLSTAAAHDEAVRQWSRTVHKAIGWERLRTQHMTPERLSG